MVRNQIVGQRPPPTQLRGTGAELVDKFTRIQIERERPNWRGTLTANYTRERFHSLLRSSVYGKYSSAPGLCPDCDQTFSEKMLIDAEIGRQFGQVNWSIGVRNLFDTFPGLNSVNNGYGIFPYPGASPFGFNGRFLYVRAEALLGK